MEYFTVDITPTIKSVPNIEFWELTKLDSPLSVQTAEYVNKVKDLENSVKSRLDPNNVYNIHTTKIPNKFTVYQKQDYFLASLKKEPELLAYWELYNKTAFDYIVKKITFRTETINERGRSRAASRKADYQSKSVLLRGLNLKSFHSGEGDGNSINSLKWVCTRAEYETRSQIIWDFAATYEPNICRRDDKWSSGADGTNRMTVDNMRAYKNKIAITIKKPDLIVCNNKHIDDTSSCIGFALINLVPGGSAIIRMPEITNNRLASLIYLFTQCFESSSIKHLSADDRVYLCGDTFRKDIGIKQYKILNSLFEISDNNVGLFTQAYTLRDEYIAFNTKLYEINEMLYNMRCEYYQDITSRYLGNIDNAISVDKASEWAAANHMEYLK
jgi:hypothetical protein